MTPSKSRNPTFFKLASLAVHNMVLSYFAQDKPFFVILCTDHKEKINDLQRSVQTMTDIRHIVHKKNAKKWVQKLCKCIIYNIYLI